MSKKDKSGEKFDEFYLENTSYYTRVPDYYKHREAYMPPNDKLLIAFIPGTIREIKVKVGDVVEMGDTLMILDAMKMNNDVQATVSGKIKKLEVAEGDMVKKNQLIIEFE